MNVDWNAVFLALVPQLLALLGLSLAQVVLGIAVALKDKIFEWQKLGDFFSTIIAPRVLTWLACMIMVLLVPEKYLPTELSGGIQVVAFFAIVMSFTGSIVANLRALGVLTDSVALDKLGLPSKSVSVPTINK
jgi:hypothetical protein